MTLSSGKRAWIAVAALVAILCGCGGAYFYYFRARIAVLPPLAVQATKRTLNQVFRNRLEEVFELGLAYEMDTFVSEDLVEAITAFRQKRAPTFKSQ